MASNNDQSDYRKPVLRELGLMDRVTRKSGPFADNPGNPTGPKQ